MRATKLIETGISFVFSEQHLAEIEVIKSKYPPARSASVVMPVLWLAQRCHHNWISKEVVETVAATLDLPLMRVYEIVSFYSMYNLSPVGTYHIQVCRTTPCWLRGSDDILQTCLLACGVSNTHQLSVNQQFSVSEVECLGACANAPVIQINNSYYEDLTPDSVRKIVHKLKSGQLELKELVTDPTFSQVCIKAKLTNEVDHS